MVSFRDTGSGLHSNDVESENNRVKLFHRRRYGKLLMSRKVTLTKDKLLNMYEYVFRVNVGDSTPAFFKALAFANHSDLLQYINNTDFAAVAAPAD